MEVMKIALLGYDVEGRASYDYFAAQGHELVIHDQNPATAVPEGITAVLGENYLDGLDRYDLLVRTAGLPPKKILDKNPSVADKITTHLDEFLKVSPTRNIIGVTGTKGKGTTSTLITKMLEAGGKTVWLGGNIGLAPLGFLNELSPDSWVVLEMSSFQLSDIKHAPHIAVCLMVVPEHLDWHANVEDYVAAKTRLFANQSADDVAIYFAENELSKQIASASKGRILAYYAPPGAVVEDGAIKIDGQVICRTDELKLLGRHNWQNVCAAVTAVWQEVHSVDALREVLTTFTGLEHRLEFVRELDGVSYYDDSYGTAPETAVVAMQAFNQPEILILGGHGKGIPFDNLAIVVAEKQIKGVITIGETGAEIASALRSQGYETITAGADNIDEIVRQARELAQPGDVVLLSTACTSFDMFKNYKERGEEFKRAVQALA
ncbi:UDP-N-acetylmuramoyl-L-alanine--D-glutamate ligase [Candidatus Saccharibacteria bacterium CG_4_10_14_0_2_um_filter_52_9]|nr:MAG: UDP-N-acetylmuramoyl-L-alanine--D-glutamate ligase [Candidatus Saccharibacteria bacterium CG_4_10_14_0_2_um_filter_52_9]